MRGAQTPGELRSRASRLCRFADVTEVEAVLDALASRPDGPFVRRLGREPGKRESRYAHLFSGEPAEATESASPTERSRNDSGGSIEQLDRRVAALEAEVAELKRRMGTSADA